MTPPIIDHTPSRSPGKRFASGTLTAAAWMLYAWLWVPLITALAWYVGARTAYLRLYLNQNEVEPFLLLSFPLIALGCAVLLIGWAEYNRMRFAKTDRRQRRANIIDDEVRIALGAAPELAAKLREGRIVRVAVDDDARPVSVNLGS
ncbi:poly-beta-1,6-N-acetyl-D-glucosamine biosynthesis protein PgaD [Luteimonas sp. WGS1318]|uniref:poly-beta-1,6-N-acetyl-D-glucosamine biosynthesis protein PgaD n=1 Tax=Luteimonas sp. WGS1318 TaxID=3366815 RepID=UPI00372D7818